MIPNSGVLVRAHGTKPARASDSTTSSLCSLVPAGAPLEPYVVGQPATGVRSLIGSGMPRNGAWSPSVRRRSASSAAARACSSFRQTMAFSSGLRASTAPRQASSSSTDESSRVRSAAASSSADDSGPSELTASDPTSAQLAAVAEHQHRANAVLRLHQLEGAVDVVEAHAVGDEGLDVDLPAQVALHELWDLVAPLQSAEGGAAHAPAGDQQARDDVEGLSLARHAGDRAHAPAHAGGFDGFAHHGHETRRLEGVVGAEAAGLLHQALDGLPTGAPPVR